MRVQQISLASIGVVLGVLFLTLAVAPAADAIPAFSRSYRTSCATCHVAFPKLNAFGEAFRNNGYRMPGGDDQFAADDPVSLGADGWKQMWPEAIWPGDMPYLPPVSLLVDGEYMVEPDAHVTNDFRVPSDTSLLAGGNFGDTLSFFGRINLTAIGEADVHVHRLYAQLNDIFGTNLLNLRLGQMEPRAVPFSSNRRLTAYDYLTNTQTFGLEGLIDAVNSIGQHGHGDDGHDEAGGGHDHSGTFTMGMPQQGLELWGVMPGFDRKGGLEYALGVVNGNGAGTPELNGGTNDNDSGKDVYWRLAYKIGGMSLLGDADTAPAQAQNWQDDSVRLGTFGYRGSAPFVVPHPHGDGHGDPHGHDATFVERLLHRLDHMDVSAHDTGENFYRLGVDADIRFKDLNLYGAYMWGETELDPLALDQAKGDFNAWFVQGDYVVFPWLIGAVRYEKLDLPDFFEGDFDRWVPNLTALLRANAKIAFDAALSDEDHIGNQYHVRFVFAF